MTLLPLTRRSFLGTAGAMSLAASPALSALQTPDKPSAAKLVQGKDPRLLVLKQYPAVFETPLKLLAGQQQTPSRLLFVRNNQQPDDAATLSPPVNRNWSVRFEGELSQPVSISLAELQEMEQTSVEMVLQCSGNGRSLFSKSAQTSGTQWGRGGMGNVVFSGVRLSAVLEKLGVDVGSTARYANASGADKPLPDKQDFLHSLPVHEVLNRSLLALDLNGTPLPAIHGGPVRLVTPGVYATMHMKWLNRIQFVGEESTNYNHLPRYRVPHQPITPGSEYEFTLENSRFNWSMKTKSVVLTPNDGDQLRSGRSTVRGVAFNDGRAKITAVYLSFDRGTSWQQALLTQPDGQYGWTQFQLDGTFSTGRHSIWCRAIDAYGRTQPDNGHLAWNPRGYEWNGIEKISVNVS